jgi:hypothetical protein
MAAFPIPPIFPHISPLSFPNCITA